MTCLGAGFAYAWWEDKAGYRCGLEFYLETQVRDRLPCPLDYLRKVMRLEWLALYKTESKESILRKCAYDPKSPWYALSLSQRTILAEPSEFKRLPKRRFCSSIKTVPKITSLQNLRQKSYASTRVSGFGICIPADATTTPPTEKVLVMPSFCGGRQVFLGKDASLEYHLEDHWLPVEPRKYRLSMKVATAHRNDVGLLVTLVSRKSLSGFGHEDTQNEGKSTLYRLALPYTKALWQESKSIEVILSADVQSISLQREWTESYGISLKEIYLQIVEGE